MISWTTVCALIMRHIRVYQHDPNYLFATFYWPILDIFTWGFLGSWIAHSHSTEFHNYQTVALLGILLWQIVGRGCNIMMFAVNEELWSYNIVNLFSLPVRPSEWMCSIILVAAIMMFFTTLFCFAIISLFYTVKLSTLLYPFFLCAPPLFLSSIWIGFTCLQLPVLRGKRSTELAYVIAWFLMPFSGAYYPLSVLPTWAQKISYCFPLSYIFQAMRDYLMENKNPTSYLIIGYCLSIAYATIALLLFMYSFNRTKIKGLARLMD